MGLCEASPELRGEAVGLVYENAEVDEDAKELLAGL
jgi:hypothetical protein